MTAKKNNHAPWPEGPEESPNENTTVSQLGRLDQTIKKLAVEIKKLRAEVEDLKAAAARGTKPVSDETIERMLSYCDGQTHTTTRDAARLVRTIARLGKVYCDADAALARSASGMDATRTSSLRQLVQLVIEMGTLCTDHMSTFADVGDEDQMSVLVISEGLMWDEQEVLGSIQDRLNLPSRSLFNGLTEGEEYARLDESTLRDLRADAASVPDWSGEWDHGD